MEPLNSTQQPTKPPYPQACGCPNMTPEYVCADEKCAKNLT